MKEREQARIDKIKAEAAREVRLQIESTADEVARRRHDMKKKQPLREPYSGFDEQADHVNWQRRGGWKRMLWMRRIAWKMVLLLFQSDSDITVCTVEEEEEEEEEEKEE